MAVEEGITLKKLEVFLAFMKTGNMARASESPRPERRQRASRASLARG